MIANDVHSHKVLNHHRQHQ